MLSIGELSRATDCKVETIRYAEAKPLPLTKFMVGQMDHPIMMDFL